MWCALVSLPGPQSGQLLGVRLVPIQFEADGRRRRFIIPRIARASAVALEGRDKSEVLLQNTPLGIVPDQPAVVANSKVLSYADYNLTWKLSDTTGVYSPFA